MAYITKTSCPKQVSGEENIFGSKKLHVLPSNFDVKQVAADVIRDYDVDESFFICDVGAVIKKYVEWIKYMPRARPYYAVKCNDSPLILETLAALGAGFDCASKGEIQKILDLGVLPTDIIYANTVKAPSYLKYAADQGVKTMTFDNATELYKFKKYHPNARIIVRILCPAENVQRPMGEKFGVKTVEEACELLRIAKSLDLNVIGVSFHVGSPCNDMRPFTKGISSARQIFDFAAAELGYNLTVMDIGGGYPGTPGISIGNIAPAINAALDTYFPESSGVKIMAEPGRFFAASTFTFCAQIHSIREVKGASPQLWYYLNDGIHGSLSCIICDYQVVHPEVLDPKRAAIVEETYDSTLYGPTCDPADIIRKNIQLPKMDVGEWLAFPNTGAYTIVTATTFNALPVAKVHNVVSSDSWEVFQEIQKNLLRMKKISFTKHCAPTGCNAPFQNNLDRNAETCTDGRA